MDGDPTRSAHVLNNSWGCPEDYEGCDVDSLLPAMRALRAAGIFAVVSAGNTGPACNTVTDPPALYDEVISVGAIDSSFNVVPFSSRGPVSADGSGRIKPDLVAPGLEVLSAYPNSTFDVASGTSMAAPHVVGAVALMWSANPRLLGDIESTERILAMSARPLNRPSDSSSVGVARFSSPGERVEPLNMDRALGGRGGCNWQETNAVPNNHAGFGIVDAYRAVQMAIDW